MSRKKIALFIILLFLFIGTVKLIIYYALKKYRYTYGGNIRQIVIIGDSKPSQELLHFFSKRQDLGYTIKGIFKTNPDKSTTGNIEQSFDFLETEHIDEIYCSLDNLLNHEVNKFIDIANKNNISLKFIPKHNTITSDKVETDFYGTHPVFSLKVPSLNKAFNQFIKRSFDIVFSLLMIIFVLSWLIPLMFIIIKIESKGPLFYKHIRYGLNYNKFVCYKFRSMKNTQHEVLEHVKKYDTRVTRIGKFIRKTSIDELPQFINVLLGDMSVVGPRPHMVPYSEKYAAYIDEYKYIFRHSVKPGITGLAQVKGFRGATETENDIVNRIKMDVFYIENWNLFLDIGIIFQTIFNIFQGEDKAY